MKPDAEKLASVIVASSRISLVGLLDFMEFDKPSLHSPRVAYEAYRKANALLSIRS